MPCGTRHLPKQRLTVEARIIAISGRPGQCFRGPAQCAGRGLMRYRGRRHVTRPPVALALALCLGGVSPAAAQVAVREEAVTMPTWEVGPPEIHPLSPGPQGAIYPYTLSRRLTDN